MKALEVNAPQFKETLTMNNLKMYSYGPFDNRKELFKTGSGKWTLTKGFPYEVDYLDFFIFKNKLTGE